MNVTVPNFAGKADLTAFTNSLFQGVIGQVGTKKELTFHLENYIYSRMFPNTMLIAPRGQGKSLIATETAKGLYQFDENGNVEMVPSKLEPTTSKPRRKKFIEINCSTLKNVKQFINGIIIPYVQDKDVTIFFDEASEIPHDIAMALLTILPVNREQSTFAYDEYVCDFDFRRQTFIFATTESQKVFHALMDRLERISLSDYTLTELGQILRKGLGDDIQATDEVLLEVATVLRGNARAAEKMAAKIKHFMRDEKVLTLDIWKALVERLSILPLGLNNIELGLLRYLAQAQHGISLTRLAAKTGMSRASLMGTEELYLQKHDLMEVTTGGRIITHKGLEYLRELDGVVTPTN